MVDIATSLLLIQSPASENSALSSKLESLSGRFRHTKDLAGAIHLIDSLGFSPNVIVVDMPEVSTSNLKILESIKANLGIHEWIFLTCGLCDDLTFRFEEMAYRNIKRPCSNKRVEIAVRKALRSTIILKHLQEHTANRTAKRSISSIVGNSKRIVQYREILEKYSKIKLRTLMIKGETGSGKGHAARILHAVGLRNEHSFVEMNCAALPKALVESQLFGHEKGAFSGANSRHRGLLEQADGGTLFLDEIGEMPLNIQAKLLKAIEEQSYRRVGGENLINIDVQIFAASNRDIQAMVVERSFREDLYHRLNVFEIVVPALREYKSDLVELVPMLMAEYNAQSGKNVTTISDQAWRQMFNYGWPGNIRELRNALERSIMLAKSDNLSTRWLNLNNTLLEDKLITSKPKNQLLDTIKHDVLASNDAKEPNENAEMSVKQKNENVLKPQCDPLVFTLNGGASLDEMHQQIISSALLLTGNNISKAAKLLGITRETLRYRVQKHQHDTSSYVATTSS